MEFSETYRVISHPIDGIEGQARRYRTNQNRKLVLGLTGTLTLNAAVESYKKSGLAPNATLDLSKKVLHVHIEPELGAPVVPFSTPHHPTLNSGAVWVNVVGLSNSPIGDVDELIRFVEPNLKSLDVNRKVIPFPGQGVQKSVLSNGAWQSATGVVSSASSNVATQWSGLVLEEARLLEAKLQFSPIELGKFKSSGVYKLGSVAKVMADINRILGVEDKTFTIDTEIAVEVLQFNADLEVTGEIDKATFEVIKEEGQKVPEFYSGDLF